MAKFKIGDRVRSKNRGSYLYGKLRCDRIGKEDELGTVTNINDDDAVEMLCDKDKKFVTRAESCLDLVKEQEQEHKNNYYLILN